MTDREMCAKAYAAGMSLGIIGWLNGGEIRDAPAREVSDAAERFFNVERPSYPHTIQYRGGEFHYEPIATPSDASPPKKRSWWIRLFNWRRSLSQEHPK